MNKKNVIIAGYPKSGTTWLSRLVAELIACPLIGDWGYVNMSPPYSEGSNRNSEFQCFKSHHSYKEIFRASDLPIHKVIYIVRDPRDVVISGVHYFQFIPSHLKLLNIGPIKRMLYRVTSKKERKRQMINAVLEGNGSINQWLSSSWISHYKGYSSEEILLVRYEDLLENPTKECNRIVNYLDFNTTKEEIAMSIHLQSFNKRRDDVKTKTNRSFKNLLRMGSSGYWKEEFSEHEVELFNHAFKYLKTPYEF